MVSAFETSRYIEQGVFPSVWIHESDEYANVDLGLPIMQFRLTYQGPLFADRGPDDQRQSRLKHRHAIRTNFHHQLSELWKLDSRLKWYATKNIHVEESGIRKSYSSLDHLQQELFKSNTDWAPAIKWAPLVNDVWGVVCGLDILFLRHEPKGGIVQSGDLDNRINTLFDAMRVPKTKEVPDDIIWQNEPDPFFCLLSDDKLIAEFRVTSDRLLVPSPTGNDADVHLIIEVRTFIADREKARLSLGQHIHE